MILYTHLELIILVSSKSERYRYYILKQYIYRSRNFNKRISIFLTTSCHDVSFIKDSLSLRFWKLLRKWRKNIYKVLIKTNYPLKASVPEYYYFTSSTRKIYTYIKKTHHFKLIHWSVRLESNMDVIWETIVCIVYVQI